MKMVNWDFFPMTPLVSEMDIMTFFFLPSMKTFVHNPIHVQIFRHEK